MAGTKQKPKKAPDAAPAKEVAVKSEFPLRITKMDAEQQKVFGWAYISVRDGQLIVDKQDDAILPDDLEKAAHEYALHFRSQGDLHQMGNDGRPLQYGRMIESLVFTQEKLEKAGLSAIDPESGEQLFGWFVGFKVDEPRLWEAHKRGDRLEFSIGGRGRRVEIGKAASSARQIQIVRHGATELNDERVSVDRIRGWSDIPLSEEGQQQALILGEKMAQDPPDVIVSSDLMRAKDTAEIVAEITGVPLKLITKGFRPWNVGIFSGMITEEAIPILADYARNNPAEIVPDGESFNSFKERFLTTLWEVLRKYDGRIAIVTHHRGERLMEAWEAEGFPDDGSIDIDVFCRQGEATGTVVNMTVDIREVAVAAE
ncbi:MAG TPA: histidine phosphatase family protein, partial [Candidatus Acidoferrales bacterium]|nr:histidine phosphatase family protein [Candidatus Acidoferrales bacterium]